MFNINFDKKNIILTGFMGSGKTTIGKYIADNLKLGYIDTDECIRKFCNMSISDIFELKGEKYFRELEHNVCEKIYNLDNYLISSGGFTLIDRKNFNFFRPNYLIIMIDTPFEICYERMKGSDRYWYQKLSKSQLYELYNERKQQYLNISDAIIAGDKDLLDVFC